MHVELVGVEKPVWSGDAEEVLARTVTGELGVLPGHTPLLGQLEPGWTVTIRQQGGGDVVAAVHGGFLSVSDEGVSILAEMAELADDIDVARAEAAVARVRGSRDGSRSADEDASADAHDAETRALARLRAAGQQV